jgi:hypothetical protein
MGANLSVAALLACEPLLARRMVGMAPLERVVVAASWFQRGGKPVPAALRRAERELRKVPESARTRIVSALVVLHPELSGLGLEVVRPVAPAYGRAPERMQALVVMGEAPWRLLPGLTPREAHDAMSKGYGSSVAYLLRDAPVPSLRTGAGVRDVAVARWICACLADPPRRSALLRESVERGPHGEPIHGVLASRVDEITTADLPCGLRTGVAAAFRSAALRAWQQWQKEAEKQHEPLRAPPKWWQPIRCAKLLGSAAELVAEGRMMAHCVAGYSSYVRHGRSVVVSIVVPDCKAATVARSTVEIDPRSGQVLQHRGKYNAEPPEICEKALRVCLKRWGFAPVRSQWPFPHLEGVRDG